MKLTVTGILIDFDLVLIELPSACTFEITELGSSTELEQAELIKHEIEIKNGDKK